MLFRIVSSVMISHLVQCAEPVTSSWKITFDPQPVIWAKSDPDKTLSIELTNVSNHIAWVFESNALNDYEVSLTDTKGKVVPMTTEGLRIQEQQRSLFFSTGKVPLPIGSSYKNHIELSYFYELLPGRYVFQVRLRTMNQDNFDWEAKKPIQQQAQDVPAGSTPIEIKP